MHDMTIMLCWPFFSTFCLIKHKILYMSLNSFFMFKWLVLVNCELQSGPDFMLTTQRLSLSKLKQCSTHMLPTLYLHAPLGQTVIIDGLSMAMLFFFYSISTRILLQFPLSNIYAGSINTALISFLF